MNKKIKNREHMRVNAKLPVMIIGEDMDVADAVYSETRNISVNGACIRSGILFSLSSEIIVSLFLPEQTTDAEEVTFISCKAVVAYSMADRHSVPFSYNIGILFTDMKEKNKKILDRFIREISGKDEEAGLADVEKRGSERISTRLQAVFLGSSLNLQGLEYAEVENISCDGVYLVSKRVFEPFDDTQMRIFIPARFICRATENIEGEDSVVSCKAKVVRLEEKRGEAGFGLGVEFTEIGQEDMNRLQEFVSFVKR